MTTIIKNGVVTTSEFDWVNTDTADPALTNVLLPLASFLDHRDALKGRNDVGVWLAADEEVESIGEFANELPVIALHFPAFADGRSLSGATLLRRRYGYEGELRAIGDVRRDQLDQMLRCGFDAFQLSDGQDPEAALQGLSGFSHSYQSTPGRPTPILRQRG